MRRKNCHSDSGDRMQNRIPPRDHESLGFLYGGDSVDADSVCKIVRKVVQSEYGLVPLNLENHTDVTQITPEGECNPMAYNRVRVYIGNDSTGKPIYTQISGKNQDEINDKIVQAYIQSGRINDFLSDGISLQARYVSPIQSAKHAFREYAEHWFTVFGKPNIEASTALTYRRQLDLYWIPAFGDKAIEEISVTDIQDVLNNMGEVAKDTKKKAMMVVRMILSQAVEDGYVPRNVARSERIRINGKAAKETEAYTVEQMQYLVTHIRDVNNQTDRTFLALAALHPLRPEEIFGLQYGDIDRENHKIHIRRAVTYPDRNQPLVKATKTESSARTIDLVTQIEQYIPEGEADAFVFGKDKPLSYQQIRRMRGRIKKDTGFDDDIVPRRFRTTVLTDLYDQTKDIKQTQAAAGHTTADMTLKHYIKGRQQNSNMAIPIANRYGMTG